MTDGVPATDIPPPPPVPPGSVEPAAAAEPKRGSVRFRRIVVVVLVVLTTIAFTASMLGVWSYRQVLNTDVFTDRVETVISDPEVIDALSRYVTDEVFTAINPEQLAADSLPAVAQPLVAPLVAAIRQFVQETTAKLLASEPVQESLVKAVEVSHRSAVKLLEGETVAGVELQGDEVVLNTLPVIDSVLQQISNEGIFGGRITIPPLSNPEGEPSDQIQELAARLGRELPPDFGQLTVFQSDAIEEAQQALDLVRRGLVILLIGTLVLIVVTMLLSTNRWRTLAQLGIGLAIAMVITRIVVNRIDERILDLVKNPENLPAVKAIDSTVFQTLDTLVVIVLVIGLVIAGLGFFFGRSDSAARVRTATARQAVRAGGTVRGASNPVSAFIVGHTDAARLIAAAIGVLILWWSGFTMSGIIITLVVVAVLLLVIELILRRAGKGLMDQPPTTAAVGDAPEPVEVSSPGGDAAP